MLTHALRLNVNPERRRRLRLRVRLPADMPAGVYRLGATIDPMGLFAESSEANNIVRSDGTFVIGAG